MKRIVFTIAVLLGCFFATITELTASTGSSAVNSTPSTDGEISISSAAELLALSEAFESEDGKSSKPKITYQEDAVYIITKDIDMKGIEWLPLGRTLGRTSSQFSATIKGNGKTIKNLNINQPDTKLIGFIGVLSSKGRVENLTIEGSIIGKSTVGGVVGTNSGGVIENCVNKATVQGYESNVGGVVGINNGAVIDCKNYGKVYCEYQSAHNLGGIAGFSSGRESYIKGCINYADITTNDNGSTLGGIVGKAQGISFNTEPGTISGCINYGYILQERTEAEVENGTLYGGASYIGGIIGHATNARIVDCHNHGKVENIRVGVDTRNASRGGSQFNAAIAAYANGAYISNCSNDATLIGSTTAPAAATTLTCTIEGFNNSGDIYNYLGEEAIGEIIVTYKTTSTVTDSKNSGKLTSNVVPTFMLEGPEAAGTIYEISTSKELQALSEAVVSSTGKSSKSSKIKYEEGATYKLTADIDLKEIEWSPIDGFNATFDGNNKKISGIKISNNTKSELCALFAFVGNKSIIKNLSVSGEITAENKEAIASIAVHSEGIIQNCSSSMKLTGNCGIGGIVNLCGIRGKVIDCTFTGEINNTGLNQYIGGIAAITGRYASISGCENISNITITENCPFIGGIVGYSARDTISMCVNNGRITATKKIETDEDRNVCIGGIAGYTDRGVISGCTNNASIQSENQRETFVGGIIGDSFIGVITCCVNNGNIVGDRSGGIVAKTDRGYITNCSNTGTIRSVVKTGGNAGGIAGSLSQAVLTNCLNTGTTISIDNACYAGGITAFSSTAVAINCVNIAPTNTDFTSLGGIIGFSAHKNIANRCSTDSYYFKEDPTSTKGPFGIANTSSDMSVGTNLENGCFAKSRAELMSDELLDTLNKKAVEINNSGDGKAGVIYVLCRWIKGENGYPMIDINTIAK